MVGSRTLAYRIPNAAGTLRAAVVTWRVVAGHCRMFTSLRALIFGEDFSTDPVSRAISMMLGAFSHGHLVVDVRLLSQANPAHGQLITAVSVIDCHKLMWHFCDCASRLVRSYLMMLAGQDWPKFSSDVMCMCVYMCVHMEHGTGNYHTFSSVSNAPSANRTTNCLVARSPS